jgi:hypothetical protein
MITQLPTVTAPIELHSHWGEDTVTASRARKFNIRIDDSGTVELRGDQWAARHGRLKITGYGKTPEDAVRRQHAVMFAMLQEMLSAGGPEYLHKKLEALGIEHEITPVDEAHNNVATGTLVVA